MHTAAIIGASGYTGAELLRLIAQHPDLTVSIVTGETQAGERVADLYPGLAAAYPDTVYEAHDPSKVDGVDVAFLALPHGLTQDVVPEVIDRARVVVDLSADFRIAPDAYEQWYGSTHRAPGLIERFVTGIPEIHRGAIAGADAVAAPGCYPTAAILALHPLVHGGVVEPEGIIVDAASGVSGAGRPPKPNTTFCAVDEDFTAYGLDGHRHVAEIDAALGAPVMFTPHLAPMNRGILATCYARPAGDCDTEALLEALTKAYADEPFVVVSERSPSTKATLGSNCAHITARFDRRTGHAVVIAAIDNLVKGASGQALQCANVALGLDETAGLPLVGVTP